MRKSRIVPLVVVVALVVVLLALYSVGGPSYLPWRAWLPGAATADLDLIENPTTAAEKIVNGAKMEARRGVGYDARYRDIAYPGGDVPPDRGACTDVVVRALRNAGYDLQVLIHEDMKSHFNLYPRRYGLRQPDANIDHRRVPNQIVFLRRHGLELPTSTRGGATATWKPGDIVYWKLPSGSDHCGVLSNALNRRGLPLVVHNISLTLQEDCLERWRIIGHFRFPAGREQCCPACIMGIVQLAFRACGVRMGREGGAQYA